MDPDMLIVVGYCEGELLPPSDLEGFVNNIRQTYDEYMKNCPHHLFEEIVEFYEHFKSEKHEFPSTLEYADWLDESRKLPNIVQISGLWAQYCVAGSTIESLDRGISVVIDGEMIGMPRESTVKERLKILDSVICNASDGKYWNPKVDENMLLYYP